MALKKSNFLTLFLAIIFSSLNGYAQDNLSFTVNGVTFNMIFVEGGTFVMGCTPEQGNCRPGERPTHKVTLSDFYMGEFQVTQELWYVIMRNTLRQQLYVQGNEDEESFGDNIVGFTAKDYAKVMPLNGEGNNFPMYFINYLKSASKKK